MSTTNPQLYKIADFLIEGKPQSCALRFDGSLAVINAIGQKFVFSPEEVKQAEKELQPKPKTAANSPSKPARKPKNTKKVG